MMFDFYEFLGVQGEVEVGPSESECRPFIEKALKSLETGEETAPPGEPDGDSKEDIPTVEITTDDSDHEVGETESAEADTTESPDSVEVLFPTNHHYTHLHS